MKKKIISLALLTLFLYACNGSENTSSSSNIKTSSTNVTTVSTNVSSSKNDDKISNTVSLTNSTEKSSTSNDTISSSSSKSNQTNTSSSQKENISTNSNQTKLYELSGRIIDEDENGVNGIIIKISSKDNMYEALTSENGNYKFSGIEKGTYNIMIVLDDKYTLNTPVEELIVNIDGDDYTLEHIDIKLKNNNINWGELS